MNISMIAAVGKNNELGANNELLWDLKKDMKLFREYTLNKTIVMGKNTYLSIGRPLPKRKNIIITSHPETLANDNIEAYKSIKEFLLIYKDYLDEIMVIGGASIYNQFLEYANTLYLTEINKEYPNADVFFPKVDQEIWTPKILVEDNENGINFTQKKYIRRKINENYIKHI